MLASALKTHSVNLVTFTDSFSCWLINSGRANSTHTVNSYLQALSSYARWFKTTYTDDFTPDKLVASDVIRFRDAQIFARRSPATINHRLTLLHIFARWAHEELGLPHIDLSTVKPVPVNELAPRWKTRQEEGRIVRQAELAINAANTPQRTWRAVRDLAMINLMLNAGLRVSEVCALTLGDIELTERKGQVTIPASAAKRNRQAVIPLSVNLRRSLAAWLDIRPSEGCHSSEWLFLGDDGKQLTTRAVQKRMQTIGAAAGVKFTPHSLRHTFVHELINAGRPIGQVQDLARHQNLKTTLRYGKAGWDELEQAVEDRDTGRRSL